MAQWLKEKGYEKDGDNLIAINMYSGESLSGDKDLISVSFLFATQGDYIDIKTMIESSSGSIEVRRVDVDMSLTELFGFFKRFHVTLSYHGMLEGHEYHCNY